MMSNRSIMPLRLKMEKVMAVHSADIELAGLTVLCGVNSTGKTTISSVLQDMIEYVLYFRQALRAKLLSEIEKDVFQPLDSILRNSDFPYQFQPVLRYVSSSLEDATEDKTLAKLRKIEQAVSALFDTESWHNEKPSSRYYEKLCSSLNLRAEATREEVENCIRSRIEELRQEVKGVGDKPLNAHDYDKAVMSKYLWKGTVELYEKNELVWKYTDDKCEGASPAFASVKRVFYVQSPFATRIELIGTKLQVTNNIVAHEVSTAGKARPNDEIIAALCKMMHGSIEYKKNTNTGMEEWMYVPDREKYPNAKECPLEMAASGIQSLANIFRLYTYNLLDDETVLVLDEPEAHLHPTWVVGYAELLVRLVKKGVRVMLASHNPDMVNALRSFALAADLDSETRFYQAQPADDNDGFDFRSQELDIGYIFDSFNAVYNQIEETSTLLRGEG